MTSPTTCKSFIRGKPVKSAIFLISTAVATWHNPAFAKAISPTDVEAASGAASRPEQNAAHRPAFNTGVARARDPLDTAISTSTIVEAEINKVSPRSMAELFRLIPGIRSEASSGDGNNGYTVRGLPLVGDGAKYIQLQENGLPVLEFGDVLSVESDNFMRVDLNLAAVQAIRGGSASTFASNAPGGIINLIEKTGDVEGGSVQLSNGLDYEMYRADVDYGMHLSDTLRFHIGGYYRTGEGPRSTGYTALKGGQIKFNMTKDFAGGYFRLYAKMFDEHSPQYYPIALSVSGTNSDPHYSDVGNFSSRSDSNNSRYLSSVLTLDENNNIKRFDVQDGNHVKSTALGFETKFDAGGWTVNEKFRYSSNRGSINGLSTGQYMPASALALAFGGPGATLSYVQGADAGQVIADPDSLNGNGLVSLTSAINFVVRDFSNVTNDVRASRVWTVGGGDLTVTGGFYHAQQAIKYDWLVSTILHDVVGGGNSRLLDLTAAGGYPISQGGTLLFAPIAPGYHRIYDLEYGVNAPYGSFNFHTGKLAIGGSVRYDVGRVRGTSLNDNSSSYYWEDMNGDGLVSSYAESQVVHFPTTSPDPVHYNYNYLSYSLSANYHMFDAFSLFVRYSKGARASADRIIFSNAIDTATGALTDKSAAYSPVKQLEGGFKYLTDDVMLNVTGFLANVREVNSQLVNDDAGILSLVYISRSYRAYGVEFEGNWRHGPFSVNAGATLTHAEITGDGLFPDLVGNKPRHQAAFIYQVVPQYDNGQFTLGASIVGTTGSYAQDVNELKMPGYTTVGAFVQYRPTDNTVLSINASNLLNARAIVDVLDGSIPASGVVSARTLLGRTVSTSVRYNF